MPESDVFIISAVRTAMGAGSAGGGLLSFSPVALAAAVFKEALRRAGIKPARVEDVLWGLSDGEADQGGCLARQAIFQAGFPGSLAGVDLARGLASAQQAIHAGAQAILAGDAGIVIAGGSGSGSRQVRAGLVDLMQVEQADKAAAQRGLSRSDLDEYAFQSQVRAAAASRKGYFEGQILPLTLPDGRQLRVDELIGVQPDRQKLAELKALKGENGLSTTGNSAQAADGAAAVLLASVEAVGKLNLMPMARIETRVVAGSDPGHALDGLLNATRLALARSGLALAEMEVSEVNEQFAGLALAWVRELGLDLEKVNPNGGVLAHGQPLAGTGAILMTKLIHELERRKGRFGLQCLGSADGQALVTIIERL